MTEHATSSTSRQTFKTAHVVIRLHPEVHKLLKDFAVADERPVSQVVRRAIVEYLTNHQKSPEEIVRDAGY